MTSGFAVASAPFDALPEPVLRVIMLALPVDARAQAACVCRGWRAFLADVSLWQVLDLTPAGGVVTTRVTENLVRGAVARAAGQLRVYSWMNVPNGHLAGLLFAVPLTDGAELQQVKTDVYLSVDHVAAMLAAAPRLQVLNAGGFGRCTELLPVLRNEPPYGPLRISELYVMDRDIVADDLQAFAAAMAAHQTLKSLSLTVQIARDVNALLDVAGERGFTHVALNLCPLEAVRVPVLARLLQRSSLIRLDIVCQGFPEAQDESMPMLCHALRACRTLTHLKLGLNPPEGASHRTVTELLDAAASLPLSVLNLYDSRAQDTAAFGRALGALLAANLPSLRTLNVEHCQLGDEGLALLLDGLAANTHLRKLVCEGNGPSVAFERDRLAPALAALAARANLDA